MNILIDNCIDLAEHIEEYKRLFPDSYTDMKIIEKRLKERENEPCGCVFGIEVSTEWQDKCFGFEIDKVTPTTVYFRYMGVWKT